MPEHAREKLSLVDQGFDPFFKDFRKLQIIRRFTNLLTEDYKDEYQDYKIFSRVEMSVTISMLLFCVLAFRNCN